MGVVELVEVLGAAAELVAEDVGCGGGWGERDHPVAGGAPELGQGLHGGGLAGARGPDPDDQATSVGGEGVYQATLAGVEDDVVAFLEAGQEVVDLTRREAVPGGRVGVIEEPLFGVEEVLGGEPGGTVRDQDVLPVRTSHRLVLGCSPSSAVASSPVLVSCTEVSGDRAASTTARVAASRSVGVANRWPRSWRSVSAMTFQRVKVDFSADTTSMTSAATWSSVRTGTGGTGWRSDLSAELRQRRVRR